MTFRGATILALIDLVQDFDVLAPILTRLQATPGVRLRVALSGWIGRRAPRTVKRLRAAGIDFSRVHRSALLAGGGPTLASVDVLLTASESSASPHRWCRALVARAQAQGVRCFTVQHGLDNLEVLAGARGPQQNILSDHVFCWPPEAAWPEGLDPATRAKLLPVGRCFIKPAPVSPTFDVGVFENLHARSYSEEDRQAVLARILGLALLRPHLRFYVRSHPAGGWLDRAARALDAPGNITFTPSGQARRQNADGIAAIMQVAKVITTPSTVALDAAQAGRPVALSLDGGKLYQPLPLLNDLAAWLNFADAPMAENLIPRDFEAWNVVTGDATSRIVAHLTSSRRK